VQARTYSFALMASAITLFAAVAGLNLALDPQNAFGTRLVPSSFRNDRFVQFAAYQAKADSYDGVLFASSRGRFIPRDELGKRMHATFADFSLDGGTLSDHVPLLTSIVRQKAAQGKPVKAVMLLIDVDEFGNPPAALLFNNTVLPPEVTGESRLKFWWRHLTWIQPRIWRSAIRDALGRAPAQPRSACPGKVGTGFPKGTCANEKLIVGAAQAQARTQEEMNPQVPYTESELHKPIRQRDGFGRDLDLLRKFAGLCRDHDVSLVVALSPLNPRNPVLLDPDLSDALDRIGAAVPLWDFSRSADLLPDLTRYWLADGSHFTEEVGLLMLRRMFGEELPVPWNGFGRRRG
jgi:hypothetical protein